MDADSVSRVAVVEADVDPATGAPHIHNHQVDEYEVIDVLERPGEDRPGRKAGPRGPWLYIVPILTTLALLTATYEMIEAVVATVAQSFGSAAGLLPGVFGLGYSLSQFRGPSRSRKAPSRSSARRAEALPHKIQVLMGGSARDTSCMLAGNEDYFSWRGGDGYRVLASAGVRGEAVFAGLRHVSGAAGGGGG